VSRRPACPRAARAGCNANCASKGKSATARRAFATRSRAPTVAATPTRNA
jgi:hypothetical protein